MGYQRYIVVGDVHGCLEELDELLRKVDHRPGKDRLVFAGDLVDRGPDPVGVVRHARELGADSVLGNHEEKHLRWANWEAKVARGETEKNPMRPFDKVRLAEHNALSEEDMDYIRAMPKLLRLDPEWIVVHAGFETNGVPVDDQKLGTICRVRDVGEDGKMAINKVNFFQAAPGSVPWSVAWKGPENVLYGHAVHSRKSPRIDNHEGFSCYGIDTGCAFGGHLTAAIVDVSMGVLRRFVQVEAKREYYPVPKGWRVGRPMSSND